MTISSTKPDTESAGPAPSGEAERTSVLWEAGDAENLAVTIALAEAGYLFSMFRNNEVGVYWTLLFEGGGDVKSLRVEVQSHGEIILIIAYPGLRKSDDLQEKLLRLNGRVGSARVSYDSDEDIIVLSHFPRSALSPSTVGYHIDNVVRTVNDVWRVATPTPERPPQEGVT